MTHENSNICIHKWSLIKPRPHSSVYRLWLLSCYNSKTGQLWQRLYGPQSLKLIIWPCTENVCRPLHWKTVHVTLVNFTFQMSPPTSCTHSHAISSSLITETPQQTIVFTSYSENKDKSFHRGNNNLPFPRSSSASIPVKLIAMFQS